MTRELLPNRRRQVRFDIEWPPTAFRPAAVNIGAGFYKDGRLGEVFVTAGKSGGPTESSCRDGAIILSLALQHGVDLDTIRHSITREEDGSPSSMLGAIIEAVAKEIGRRPPDEPQAADPAPAPKPLAPSEAENG